MSKSAGRPGRSVASQILPGQVLINPNDVTVGKKVYPNSGTVGQYIPEHVAQEQWMKGGKRVEPPLTIRQGSPPSSVMKPNAAIHSNRFDRVNIGPMGAVSTMPENVQN